MRVRVLALLAVAASATSQVSGQTATFTPIPTLVTTPRFSVLGEATDISDDGRWVVWYGPARSAPSSAWEVNVFDTMSGTSVALGTASEWLGFVEASSFFQISGDGRVVGGLGPPGASSSSSRARVFFRPTNSLIELPEVPGGTTFLGDSSAVFAVNRDGSVLGGTGIGGGPSDFLRLGAVWNLNLGSQTASVSTPSTPGGVGFTTQLIGVADLLSGGRRFLGQQSASSVQRAFVLNPDGTSQILPNILPSSSFVFGSCISPDGDFVGGTVSDGALPFPTLWSRSGSTWSMSVLPDLGDGGNINAVSSGGERLIGTSGPAVVWENGQLTLLKDRLIAAGAAIPSSFILREAFGLTPDGTTIVGSFRRSVSSSSPIEPFVATLPLDAQSCPADIAGQGASEGGDSALDNNDFVLFISWFFAADPRADIGSSGADPLPDGVFDNNDFIVFIQRFFAGC